MRKFIAALGIVSLGVFSGSATAQQDPPPYGGQQPVVVIPGAVGPGEDFTATLEGCAPGETVTFAIEDGDSDSATCATAAAGLSSPAGRSRGFPATVVPATGAASVVLTAPTTPGTYDLVVTGSVSGPLATGTLNVVGAAAPTPGPQTPGGATPGGALPDTGSDNGTVFQIAGAAVLVGALLVGIAWRRRRMALA